MANGQTLDPHAKVSDKQIKCLVSGETNATQGSETRKFGVKGRVNNAEITTTISIIYGDDNSKVCPLSRSV